MSRLLKHIAFRKDLGKHFSKIRQEQETIDQNLLKHKFLLNSGAEVLLVVSAGGVASTNLIKVLDAYSPYLVNPVIRCSIHNRLIDQKLKHLISPLSEQGLDLFPAFFKQDLIFSKFKPAQIGKAIFVAGDPALSVLSIYRRGLEQDLFVNMKQDAIARVPNSLEAFLELGEDVFGLEEQYDNWLKKPVSYPRAIVKSEALWDHIKEIAEFAEVNEKDLNKNFRKQRRNSIKNTQYKQLAEGIYQGLISKMKELPAFQII